MTSYSYQALTTAGNKTQGYIEAESPKHARQLLREQGLSPLTLNISTQTSKKSFSVFHARKIPLRILVVIIQSLATLIKAGFPIEEAIHSVALQQENPKAKQILMTIRVRILEGLSFAESLKEFPKIFDETFSATIAAGERTGHLPYILDQLALFSESQQKIRDKIQQALIYPIMMTTVAFFIVSFLLSYVVPKFVQVFSDMHQQLPVLTRFLISVSQFFNQYGVYFIILILLLLVGFFHLLKKPFFAFRWQVFLLKIPMIGKLMQTTQISRYLQTLAILYHAGVPIIEALKIAAVTVQNKPMQETLLIVADEVREGRLLNQAFRQSKLMQPMVQQMIGNGETSGHLAKMLEHAGQFMEVTATRRIDTLLTLFEPILILLMGAVVLFIVLAILLPIFSLDQMV